MIIRSKGGHAGRRRCSRISLQGGVGYWAESLGNGAEGFRFHPQANIVLPR